MIVNLLAFKPTTASALQNQPGSGIGEPCGYAVTSACGPRGVTARRIALHNGVTED
jgi:hypothetical protein